MTRQCHPLATVVDACAPLRFAPLPDLRLRSFTRSGDQGDAGQWCRADLLAAKNAFAPVYDGFVAATRPGHRLPAATHFLRAVFREPIFLVAAGLY
ncbi:MAG UNVERIFIED_CONTAM: ferric iron reductase FhuF-like transporter family protein, partial [Thermobifida fusca]